MTLKKRVLGKSGIEVTEIGLGLWAAGGGDWGEADSKADAAALTAIEAALDAGVTFFDTADVYGPWHSEILLGKAMQGRRDRFVVATKIGWQGYDEANNCSGYKSVDQVIAGVETNLQRLQTDYVDVIQLHIDFRESTMEVFLEAFEKLQAAGKVRAFGVSSGDFEYIKAFSENRHCATLQIDYSILNRTPELEILDYCKVNDIGVIVRGALAMGLLTGKFSRDTSFPDDDFRQKWLTDPEQNTEFKNDLAKVETLRSLAGPGRTLAQAALQFVLKHDAVTTVIPGARTAAQVQANVFAAEAPGLSAEDMALIERVTPTAGGRKIWPA
jgi:aryl-alcohol dehydrogenase-like predicted oxidoreductase